MNHTVTLHAKAPDIAADQKESVGRSMGRVASAAALKLLGLMLKDPGASFFRMAFIANVSIEFVYLPQARAVPASMRRVTV